RERFVSGTNNFDSVISRRQQNIDFAPAVIICSSVVISVNVDGRIRRLHMKHERPWVAILILITVITVVIILRLIVIRHRLILSLIVRRILIVRWTTLILLIAWILRIRTILRILT